MSTADQHARKRLGRLLAARRIELGARYRNKNLFAEERDINRRMLWRLESGADGNYRGDTLRGAESAYMLVPGSLDRSLESGEMERLPAAPRLTALPSPPAGRRLSEDDSDEEIAARIKGDPVAQMFWRMPHPRIPGKLLDRSARIAVINLLWETTPGLAPPGREAGDFPRGRRASG